MGERNSVGRFEGNSCELPRADLEPKCSQRSQGCQEDIFGVDVSPED